MLARTIREQLTGSGQTRARRVLFNHLNERNSDAALRFVEGSVLICARVFQAS